MISGWKTRYLSILKELKYSEKKDKETAIILDSILRKTKNIEKIEKLIQENTVFVIGSGPSLSFAIPKLKKFKKSIKIANSLIKGQGRILVRKSGTEPKIRIMGESKNKVLLKKCIKLISKAIK